MRAGGASQPWTRQCSRASYLPPSPVKVSFFIFEAVVPAGEGSPPLALARIALISGESTTTASTGGA